MVMLALCFTASPVLAEEVLDCADTANTGFKWDEKGQASKADFAPRRFIVKIGQAEGGPRIRLLSQDERLIRQTSEGRGQGSSDVYRCKTNAGGSIVCNEITNTEPWMFAKNGHYVRAYLLGGPTGRLDRNIEIVYGICTKP
jgi:hypothetical protein